MVQQTAPLDRPADQRQQVVEMEEEIDLRQYIVVLFRYRYWIVGLVIVAALVSFGVSLIIPPTYEATTLVTVTQPRYQLQFDPRFQNIPEWYIPQWLQSQYRAYPALATNDELFQQLAKEINWSLDNLQDNLRAEASKDDPSLLILTVRGKNAEEVATIANRWSNNFVSVVNKLYGVSDAPEKFEEQLIQASQTLTQADTALTTFRAENGFGYDSESTSSNSDQLTITNERDFKGRFGLIGQRLQTKKNLLTDYEAELVRLHQMQHEVELLSATTNAETSPVVIAGLLFEMINSSFVKDSTQSHQIQLDSVDPVAALTAMDKALESQTIAVEAEIKKLQDDITTLQGDLATKQNQLEQLTRERDVATETYQVISRKVQEARLDPTSGGSNVKIASQAVVPIKPVSPKLLLNTAIAGAMGLVIGIFGAFAWEWWRSGQTESSRPQTKTASALATVSPTQD